MTLRAVDAPRVAIVWFVAIALLSVGCGGGSSTVVNVGSPLPDLDLRTLDGAPLGLDDVPGEGPLILSFWATWCEPCVREVPTLASLHREGEARVLAVSIDGDPQRVVPPFVERHRIDYPIAVASAESALAVGAVSIPFTLVLDDAAVVRAVHDGYTTRRALARSLWELRGADRGDDAEPAAAPAS
ncbi:MAG: TlpA disulfide reductase family protein [Acidobacteriota bacterium]